MADTADASNNIEYRILEMRIEQARKNTRTIEHNGICHWCNDPVDAPKLFCDSICASEHGRFGK